MWKTTTTTTSMMMMLIFSFGERSNACVLRVRIHSSPILFICFSSVLLLVVVVVVGGFNFSMLSQNIKILFCVQFL